MPVRPLRAAVRQAAIVIDRDCLRVEFLFGAGTLAHNTDGTTAGRSTARLSATLAFDTWLVTDLLRVLPAGGTVELDLRGSDRTALFRYGDTYRYLVMPLA